MSVGTTALPMTAAINNEYCAWLTMPWERPKRAEMLPKYRPTEISLMCGIICASALTFDRSELDRHTRIEDAHAFAAQQREQLLGLCVGDDELHLDRHVGGQLEEVLLVQDAVTAEAGHRAECRSALDAEFFRLLEQPFEQRDVAMGPVLLTVQG